MQNNRARHVPLLAATICTCLVGMTGCSEALQTWWGAQHGGDHEHPTVDAGKPNERDASTAVSCGSRGLPACADDEFCSFPAASSCGEADQPGVCTVFAELCPTIVLPVCGCDGKTFNNECEAARIGVSVRANGACQPSAGATCGGLRGAQCADGQYCDFARDALCGSADATGTCTVKPQICNDLFAPVCGCDDMTYSNACRASAAGVSVAADGACAKACGGIAGMPCADGQYCDLAAGNGCDIADAQGRCAAFRKSARISTRRFVDAIFKRTRARAKPRCKASRCAPLAHARTSLESRVTAQPPSAACWRRFLRNALSR